MNTKKFIKSKTNYNSFLKNSQRFNLKKKNQDLTSSNIKDIYNILPQKENVNINNQSAIAVIRKRILKEKNISLSSLNTQKSTKKDEQNEKAKLKIEVNKKMTQNKPKKRQFLRERKSFNETQFNNDLKKSFSKKLNKNSKSLERSLNNLSQTDNHNITYMKYNSNKQFSKISYNSTIENKSKNPISLKNRISYKKSNYIYSKINQSKEKNPKLKYVNDNSSRYSQLNIKRNNMEMEKIFYKKNDIFSNTTYNIYNVHTPIYNLISFPSVFNNQNKRSSSPKYFHDLSNLSLEKKGKQNKKKPININCFFESDFENEKSQMVSKDLNMTEKDFKKNSKINNGSFSSTINYRNDKFIHTYSNIFNDRVNYFKSSNGLKTTKNNNNNNNNKNNNNNNNNNKEENLMAKINNYNRNSNHKKNKTKITGLKKYLTYFPNNNSAIDKKFHTKQQSVSIYGQMSNHLFKDSIIEEKPKVNKRVMKINSCTLAGYTAPGIQKINQDSFFIKKDFLNKPEHFFIGICDGHGMQGHFISDYVAKALPIQLKDINDEDIKKAYLSIHNSLQNENKIDSSLSGTTCTSILVSLNKVICANVGDSRAVLARYENGTYNATNLSRDHKPTESDEMKRILSSGGRIKQYYDDKLNEYIGPDRIWLKNSEIPGLAMSRSIGDSIAHSVGVIAEPEIFTFDFVGNEKFIVIASDGIWEYIDSEECIKIIKDFYENNMDAVGGLNALVKEAFKRWKIEEDNIDDITAIVLFFE